jgi:hypothetical protein
MGDPWEPAGDDLLELLREVSQPREPADRGGRIRLLRRTLEARQPNVGALATPEAWRRLRSELLLALGAALVEEAVAGRPEAIDEALEALTEAAALVEDEPERRIGALRLLGVAALERRGGRRADNVERAIEALGEARALAGDQPGPSAEIDRLLAVAYLGQLAGDRGESLERAREHAERASEGLDRERDPLGWASARFVLGEACRLRPDGDELDNLRRAVRCFESAADVKSRLAGPAERAEVEAALLDSRVELLSLSLDRPRFYPASLDRASLDRASPDLDLPSPEAAYGESGPREERLDEALTAEPAGIEEDLASAVDHAAREIERGRDAAEEARRPPRWVGTGFAATGAPGEPLPATRPLAAATHYLFWFQIADRPVAGGIDDEPAPLAADLHAEAELDVVLFGFSDGLEIAPGADVGRLRLTVGGAEVLRQPGDGVGLDVPAELAGRCLLFSVRTPDRSGAARLRCNLYHRGLLLQSRLVSAWVAAEPPEDEPALVAELDFNLSASLDPAALADHGEVALALMLNDDGEDAHGLRLWAGEDVKLESSLGEGALDDLVEQARGALRRASWGSEREWGEPEDGEAVPPVRTYRYHERLSPNELRDDLVRLAIRGYRFYTAAIGDLAGDGHAARALGKRLRAPGRVQIVERRREGRGPVVLPAALFYDFIGFDTNLPPADYRLCPDFERALANGEELVGSACFEGRCPVRDDPEQVAATVCPSGFWGYRHALGLPTSVSEAGDAPPLIAYHGAPDLMVAVSLDPGFKLRGPHEAKLHALRPGLGWYRGASRREVLDLLRATRPHLVYFYCHGGLSGTLPFVLVGPPGERGITPDNLFTVLWEQPRPLVFLNGCHTAALSSRRAFRFVDALVKSSRAAGVIGTEITVFEELARDFAEACLTRFLVEELPIGEAVRRARLDLLARGNPLGLVYVPYVLPGVRLQAAG